MKYTLLLFVSLTFFNCNNLAEKPSKEQLITSQETNKADFNTVLQKHLKAVSNKDLETLKSTLSPNGNMQLILPKTETTNTVSDFVKYHQEWFAAPIEWSFSTKVQNTTIGETVGMAVVEVVYKEPLRDGKPYFNRMIVSYDLEKINGNWYFIKDHASSVEKSTD